MISKKQHLWFIFTNPRPIREDGFVYILAKMLEGGTIAPLPQVPTALHLHCSSNWSRFFGGRYMLSLQSQQHPPWIEFLHLFSNTADSKVSNFLKVNFDYHFIKNINASDKVYLILRTILRTKECMLNFCDKFAIFNKLLCLFLNIGFILISLINAIIKHCKYKVEGVS